MTKLTAFLHGYPPQWSMGGEVSTHRTLRVVPGSTVFTDCESPYSIDGVSVYPIHGFDLQSLKTAATWLKPDVLFGHSAMSTMVSQTSRVMRIPFILAVHAPMKYSADLRRAWPRATARLYNTEAARKDWNDPNGWVLHPPVGQPLPSLPGPRDALTLTSSLLNKGVNHVLELAYKWSDRRFIIVNSPAHLTHGSASFAKDAASLPNVEVWDRLHPDEMNKLWAETRVLLVPSRYETYGMSAVEAAGHGIPSVHVNTPHVLEGIGDAAYLLDNPQVQSLETGILEIERDYDHWVQAARSRFEERSVREERELAVFTTNVAAL